MKKLASILSVLLLGVCFAAVGCEVSHTEKTSEGWFGETKHQETTVTKNPVTGDTNVTRSETRTR